MRPEIVKFSADADRLFPAGGELRKLSGGYRFSEGPVWDSRQNRLYFTDFFNDRIYQWTEREGASLYREKSNWAVGLSMDSLGRIVAAEGTSRSVAYTDHEKSVMVAGKYQGKILCGPNDVVVSMGGDFFFTDQYPKDIGGPRELAYNGVYRTTPGGEISLLNNEIGRPNGIAFSPDESILYVNDTDTQEIFSFHMKSGGTVSEKKVFAVLDRSYGDGAPDGMKVDIEGNVYVTGPGGIWIIGSAGVPLAVLKCPEYAGNLCFGGGDSKTLFVTASTSLYALSMGIPGIVPYRKEE
ncbi:MAG: SMP-30/gluconolactonase/LRE family protein [Treponema sp.]|jgi:gluconolactonase|nr:SMP-30/gluconolactonase/LRE family protein [Treponema sp.]